MVISTECALLEPEIDLDNKCRELRVGFISAQTRGVFAKVFCDFGARPFVTLDPTGEPPLSYHIVGVSQVYKNIYALIYFIITHTCKLCAHAMHAHE